LEDGPVVAAGLPGGRELHPPGRRGQVDVPHLGPGAGKLRLARGLDRDGQSHRQLWLDWMEAERRFFAQDGTRARADLQVDGNPSNPHDPMSEVVLLD